MTTKRIIVVGEGILNNIKDVDGYRMVFIDSKNEGENVYNSLYKYLLTNLFSKPSRNLFFDQALLKIIL